jgi:ribosomal protein S3
MGQKVNPYGFRLGVTTDWKSRWFSDREYTEYLTEDWKIRNYIMGLLPQAAISRIEIERTRDRLRVDVHTARPGIVIGKKGAGVESLHAVSDVAARREKKDRGRHALAAQLPAEVESTAVRKHDVDHDGIESLL